MAEILRTEDGTLYESEDSGSGLGEISWGKHGRPVRIEADIGTAVRTMLNTLRRELADSGVGSVTVEFGLKLDSEAGFVVSRGTAGAHVVLRFDLDRSEI